MLSVANKVYHITPILYLEMLAFWAAKGPTQSGPWHTIKTLKILQKPTHPSNQKSIEYKNGK